MEGIYCQPIEIKTYHDLQHTQLKEIYYINDSISAELNGLYRSYYLSGSLEKKGYYKHNLPDSLWIYNYESGQVRMKGLLKGGVSHGLWEYFYENGNLSMAGVVIDSKRQGNWKYYFENGNLKSQGEYSDNLKNGIWNYFYEDGHLKAQEFFSGNKSRYKEFYPDGNIKAIGKNLNGKSDSTWVFYYENDNVKATGNYKDGMRTGLWTYYFDNEVKSAEGSFINGDREGKWIYYHENGTISSEGALRKGKKEGYWKIFGEDGLFKAEGVYKANEGKYTEYYESGKVKADGFIADGQKQGHWTYYYEDGEKEGACDFDKGSGVYTGYYPDGSIKMQGKVENGVNVGLWKLYNGDGSLAGYYRPYYENNQPVYKLVEPKSPPRGDYIKPAYKYKSYKSRHFDPVINEYKGVIFGTQPLAIFLGQLPISCEYYIEERLGYEGFVTLLRDPFFAKSQNVGLNKVYDRGFNIGIKQKFYQPEGNFGMFYFGHEVRITSLKHYANVIDSLSGLSNEIKIHTSETKFEYALFIGDRWMRLFGESYKNNYVGFTIDAFLGFGFGYRLYEKKYPANPLYDDVFKDINDSKLTITPRFGINFGFVF